jgi:hypothetical protein
MDVKKNRIQEIPARWVYIHRASTVHTKLHTKITTHFFFFPERNVLLLGLLGVGVAGSTRTEPSRISAPLALVSSIFCASMKTMKSLTWTQ